MGKLHVIDGGLSTELERIGTKIEGDLWTGHALLDRPELVEKAHRNYAEAGAEIVITSSYQVSRLGFEEQGLSSASADSALIRSIELARSATAETQTKVAASIGPYGALLHDGSEYRGDYMVSQSFLEDLHFERIQVLASAEPDYLAIETIPNVVEAKAIAEVLKEFQVPRWLAFTAGSAEKLWSGEFIQEAIEVVSEINHLVAVGVNCVSPELVSGLLKNIASVTNSPLIAYPNRGGTWDSANGVWLGQKPRALSEWAGEWQDAGVTFIGGCCGTTAVDIAGLAKINQ